MKRNDTNEYRSRILGLLAQLRDDVDRMAGVGAENASIVGGREPTRMPTHMADIAGDAFDQECEFSLLKTKEEMALPGFRWGEVTGRGRRSGSRSRS
jgi:hypothetical protein